jgi:hypothetical protein
MKAKKKILSIYTIARYCSDITDVTFGIDEIREKIIESYRTNKKCPSYFYIRLSRLEEKLTKLTNSKL